MYEEIILTNKPNLIKWLKSDSIHILQYVQSKEIVTSSQYDELMSKQVPRDVVIKLLDIILAKGENGCREFLNLLKNDDVNEFSPELREWIKTVDTSVQKPQRDWVKSETDNRSTGQEMAKTAGQSGIQVTNYQKFLKTNFSLLVQKVKNIDSIVDDLDWHCESIANVRAKPTNQKKMRELLDCVNCESMAKELFNALLKHEESLMNELLN